MAVPDYSAWPTRTDVSARLAAAGISLRSAVTTDDQDSLLAEVIQDVTDRTKRQFVAATATRQFDGSGTAEMELDDYVSLASVTLLGWLGSGNELPLTDVIEISELAKPKTRIALFRGTVPAVQRVYIDRFPEGRRNIEVVASWGYGATIPVDLWRAVAGEAAARLAAEALFNAGTRSSTGAYTGRLKKFTDEDVSQEYELVPAGDGTLWTRRFGQAVKRYTKPSGARLRQWKSPLI